MPKSRFRSFRCTRRYALYDQCTLPLADTLSGRDARVDTGWIPGRVFAHSFIYMEGRATRVFGKTCVARSCFYSFTYATYISRCLVLP